MPQNQPRVKIHASLLPPLAGSREIGLRDPNEIVYLTVLVRPRIPRSEVTKHVEHQAGLSPGDRQHMTRSQFAQAHGADPADLDKVKAFATSEGLTVLDASVPRRTVHLMGTVAAVDKAFGVVLKTYEHDSTVYRDHDEPATVPADLGPIIEAIFGFDTRPYVRPHFRIAKVNREITPRATGGPDFYPNEIAAIYNFPADVNGAGQVIGIIELSAPGGSGFRPSELQTYFQSLGLPTPEVIAVSVDGGQNMPGTDATDLTNADGEVMLDIEVAGAVAPGALIVVYFAPNTAQGFFDVINRAVHDSDHNPTVISLSWGGAENPSDPMSAQLNQVLQDAAAMGVTVCVASGDSGSRDNPNDPDHAAVDFPASSPFALACGGTTLQVTGTAISQEVVWQDHSGGGVSRVFDLPTYQLNANVPAAVNPVGPVRRGVPDVAGDADPATGYKILVDGQSFTIGGTSAVAPLWAGLIARINQKLGKAVGFINTTLYNNPGAFHDITSGGNIDYQAGPGWDACTGLGSPNGPALLQALGGPATASASVKIASNAPAPPPQEKPS
jgi:kumamolisin